jgi:ankyrin repeat protein
MPAIWNEEDIDGMGSYGRTPLSWAAANSHEAVVHLLFKKNVHADNTDHYGRTPLSWAAENGREVVGLLLLNNSAQVNSIDSNGRTPLF